MKRALNIGIVFRFATSDGVALVAALERCLDSVEQSSIAPVHWSYPVAPLLSDSSSRADRLLERLRRREEDCHLPMGFTAAYHQLLSPEELERELRWASKNPWGQELESVIGAKPTALFPLGLDLIREPIKRVYGTAPPLLVSSRANDRIARINADHAAALPLLDATHHDPRRLMKTLLRCYRREVHSSLIILLDGLALSGDGIEALLTTIRRLQQSRRGFRIDALDPLFADGVRREEGLSPSGFSLPTIPTDPGSIRYRRLAAAPRKGRRPGIDELTRRRLGFLAPVDPDATKRAKEGEEHFEVEQRTLVADMSGEVLLAEEHLSVQFTEGRISRVFFDNRPVTAEIPTRPAIICGEHHHLFEMTSAFSFTSEGMRGLRAVEHLDGEGIITPGMIITDYFFEEGREDLRVEVSVTYPELREAAWVDEHRIMELPLFVLEPQERLTVDGVYPDGDRYTLTITAEQAPPFLCGSRFQFRFAGRSLSLAFEHGATDVPEVLPIALRAVTGGVLLSVNPRGSYSRLPASSLVDARDQFRLSITAAIESPPAPGREIDENRLTSIQ